MHSIEAIRPGELPSACHRLTDLLEDPSPAVREAVQTALEAHLTSSIETLCNLLADPNTPASRRRTISRFFARCASLTEADGNTPLRGLRPDVVLVAMRELLFDLEEDDQVRQAALQQIQALEKRPDAVAGLAVEAFGRARLRFDNPELLASVASRLALRPLLEALRDPDPEVRTLAACLVMPGNESSRTGEEGREVVVRLISLLDDADGQVRLAAANAISSQAIGPPQEALVIEKLRAVLRDRTSQLRPGSWCLANDDMDSGPVSISVGRRSDAPMIRTVEATVLGTLAGADGTAAAVPDLIEAMKDGDPLVRLRAIHSLGQIGEKAAPAVLALVGSLAEKGDVVDLSSEDSPSIQAADGGRIRKWSAWSLGEIGESARPSVPALIHSLEDPNPAVREAAAEALGQLAGFDPAAVAALTRALRDRFDPTLAEAAAASLATMQSQGIPVLIEELRSDDPDARVLAANSFRSMGDEAKAALPALRLVSDDPDSALRQAATQAIKQIESGDELARPKDAVGDADAAEPPR
jgi:HEAT repeat protein